VAQFEVYKGDAGELLLDCQSDLLRHLNSRLTVPLMTLDRAPTPAARLNPLFEVNGERRSMVTQFASAIPARRLKAPLCSLADERFTIIAALDLLISGS